jgi:hypothetical protein
VIENDTNKDTNITMFCSRKTQLRQKLQQKNAKATPKQVDKKK